MGPQGRAAASFAAQSAPRVAAGYRGLSRSVSGGSALGGVTKALSGSEGGMGFPMPLILIGTLAASDLLCRLEVPGPGEGGVDEFADRSPLWSNKRIENRRAGTV